MVRLPLEGVRVVESTYVFAFPYAAALLTDWGAEVIKVEGPAHIDTTRGGDWAPAYPDANPGPDPWNRAANFHQLNRGKKSLTLDLSKKEGRDVLVDLLKVTDVFMENYTPRVMRNWGLDYPNLKKIKPDIIMASNTGFGHGNGPYSSYGAQATTQESTHGHCHVTGYLGGMPSKAGASFVDFLACWSGLLSIATALRHRNRTGKGQWIDIGMYQLGCYLTGEYVLDYEANGRLGGRMGNRHPWRVQGCYPCAGDDQWCVVSVGDDEEWAALRKVIGKPELLLDSRFATLISRLHHHDALDEIIASWTKERDKFAVMEALQGAGIPAGPVNDPKDFSVDPNHWTRGFLEKVDFPLEAGTGRRVLMGLPYRLSKTPMRIKGPAPRLGDANQELIQGVLGYGDEEYRELQQLGIVANRPARPGRSPSKSVDDLVKEGRLKYRDPLYKDRLGIEAHDPFH